MTKNSATVAAALRTHGTTYAEQAGIRLADTPSPLYRLLGRGHYRRYDERTSTMLGEGAELLLSRYRGDLRRLRDESASVSELEGRLQEFPGIGPAGAAIFCREVQGVWADVAPYADERVAAGARRLGLPTAPERLAGLVDDEDLPRLTAACVRASLDDAVADEIRRDARGR